MTKLFTEMRRPWESVVMTGSDCGDRTGMRYGDGTRRARGDEARRIGWRWMEMGIGDKSRIDDTKRFQLAAMKLSKRMGRFTRVLRSKDDWLGC